MIVESDFRAQGLKGNHHHGPKQKQGVDTDAKPPGLEIGRCLWGAKQQVHAQNDKKRSEGNIRAASAKSGLAPIRKVSNNGIGQGIKNAHAE